LPIVVPLNTKSVWVGTLVDDNHQIQNTLIKPVKVLVIDDDDDLVEVIQTTFYLGWPEANVIRAETGQKGISIIESGSPSIIVLDLARPSIDGFELLKQIRGFSGVPIVVLVANDDEKNIVKAFTWGANGCLVKPFRQMEFLARVKSLTSTTAFAGRMNSINRGSSDQLKEPDAFRNNLNQIPHAWEQDKHIVGQCPKCSSILVYQQNLLACPVCGFNKKNENNIPET
jgi:CheY-like chemotaxis protein